MSELEKANVGQEPIETIVNAATGINETPMFLKHKKHLMELIDKSVDYAAKAHQTEDKELIVSAKDKIHRIIAEEFVENQELSEDKIDLYVKEIIEATIAMAAKEEVGNRVREEAIEKMSSNRIEHFNTALTGSGYELILENDFEKFYAKQNSESSIDVIQYDLATSTTQLMYGGIIKAVIDNFVDSKDLDYRISKAIKGDPKNRAAGICKRMNAQSMIIGSGKDVYPSGSQHTATSVHKAPFNKSSALLFTNVIIVKDTEDKMANASIANTTTLSLEGARAIKEFYTKTFTPQTVVDKEISHGTIK